MSEATTAANRARRITRDIGLKARAKERWARRIKAGKPARGTGRAHRRPEILERKRKERAGRP